MSSFTGISELRQRITLQSPVDTPDGEGGFSRQWQTIATVWASSDAASPRMRFEAAQQEYSTSHRITIRWRPDVSAAMRLSDGVRHFLINGAYDADGRRDFMICYCEEVSS